MHVDQYYLRADTSAAANARLIATQAGIPIVRCWGDGLLASVDGLRFQVPVRTVNAAPSPCRWRPQSGRHALAGTRVIDPRTTRVGRRMDRRSATPWRRAP